AREPLAAGKPAAANGSSSGGSSSARGGARTAPWQSVSEDRETLPGVVEKGKTVLVKLSLQRKQLPVVGERKAQVTQVAVNTLVGCVELLDRQRVKQIALGDEVFGWLVIVLDCAQLCGLDIELLLVKVGRELAQANLNDHLGTKLIWFLGERVAFAGPTAQTSPDAGPEDAKTAEARICHKNLSVLFRLAIVAHCFEMCSLTGARPSNQPDEWGDESVVGTLGAGLHIRSQRIKRDAVLVAMDALAKCPKDEVVCRRTAFLIHAMGNVVQHVLHRSADQGGPLVASVADLAAVLADGGKLGWLAKQVHGVGGQGPSSEAPLSGSRDRAGARPTDPWRASKVNVEIVFEFLLQRIDPLGVQGGLLAKEFLHLVHVPWNQVSEAALEDFLMQVSVQVMRCASSHLIVAMDRAHRHQEDDHIRFIQALLHVYISGIETSFKMDRHAAQRSALGVTSSSLVPVSYSTAISATVPRPAPNVPYLSRGAKHVRHMYLTLHEREMTDLVAGIALPLFRYFASTNRKRMPDNLERAVHLTFARVGSSDLHWKTIWTNGSKDVFTTDWTSSEFEVSAAVLRSAVGTVLSTRKANPLGAEMAMGIVSSLHELVRDNIGSIQQQVRQARKYHPEVAANGEYTVAMYSGRLAALLIHSLCINSNTRHMARVHASFNDSISNRLATILQILSARAGNAKLVHSLHVQSVLAWIPALAQGIGDADDTMGEACGRAFLEMVKVVAIRGSMDDDEQALLVQQRQRHQSQLQIENSVSQVDRPLSWSEAELALEERVAELDMIMLRVMEIWHTLFATGKLPKWLTNETAHCERDPKPFSPWYSKDLMLILTQAQKLKAGAAPEWFRPFAALRHVRAAKEGLEAELRTNLLPFRNFPNQFMHGSERLAYGRAGELLLPRLDMLCEVLEAYAVVWQWTRADQQRVANNPLLALGAAIVEPPSMGPSGALGSVVKSLQLIAETFVSFGCLRGRIAASYYTHEAAQVLRDAGDLWESGNALAMVANCIVGSAEADAGRRARRAHREKQSPQDGLHDSIASLFLQESVNVFDALGAEPERNRIQEILEDVTGGLDASANTGMGGSFVKPKQHAVSFYFLVGAPIPNEPNATPSIRLSPLNVARIVMRVHPGQRDGFATAETLLIERLQQGTGLGLVEGRLAWETRNEWRASETSTLATPQVSVVPKFDHIATHRNHYHQVNAQMGSAAASRCFWLRRLWPVEMEPSDGAGQPSLLRCPRNFVLLNNELDIASLPADSSGIGLDIPSRNGVEVSMDRVVLCTDQDEPLSTLVALATVKAGILSDDVPPLPELLEASPFGRPVDHDGKQLEPFPRRRQLVGHAGLTDLEQDERFPSDSDSDSDLSSPPRPPSHPPPSSTAGHKLETSSSDELEVVPPPSHEPILLGDVDKPEHASPKGNPMAGVLSEIKGAEPAKSLRSAPQVDAKEREIAAHGVFASVVDELAGHKVFRERPASSTDSVGGPARSAASSLESSGPPPPLPPKPDMLKEDIKEAVKNAVEESSPIQEVSTRDLLAAQSQPEPRESSAEIREHSNSVVSVPDATDSGREEEREVSDQEGIEGKKSGTMEHGAMEGNSGIVLANEGDPATKPELEVVNPLRKGAIGTPKMVQAPLPRGSPPVEEHEFSDWKVVGGQKLTSSDASLVASFLKDQEAWFNGYTVDRNGPKEMSLRVVGTPSGQGVVEGNVNGSESSSSSTAERKARRRPSLIASVLRPRKDSNTSSADARSRNDTEESTNGSIGNGTEHEGLVGVSNCMQLWIGKSSGGLIRRRSRSFKIAEELSLQGVQVDESSKRGVVRIIAAERAKRGENPILFQTDAPALLLATVAEMQDLIDDALV
ncbi:Uncharacterized protein SCF082_LOCUS7540, partial [Durusdinium trenchii]